MFSHFYTLKLALLLFCRCRILVFTFCKNVKCNFDTLQNAKCIVLY